jgi:hypothetical protein
VVEHVHLVPRLGERAAGRVQQADPPVIAPVHDDILSRPCVTKEQELKVQAEQVRHRVERRLRQWIRGAPRDNVAQVRRLETRPRPVLVLVSPALCAANGLPFSTSDASATHRRRAALVSGCRSVRRSSSIGSSV